LCVANVNGFLHTEQYRAAVWEERILLDLPDETREGRHQDEPPTRVGSEDDGLWLHAQVFDHNTIAKHECLGRVSLRLEDVFPHLRRSVQLVRDGGV
jgi:hypothetical protein